MTIDAERDIEEIALMTMGTTTDRLTEVARSATRSGTSRSQLGSFGANSSGLERTGACLGSLAL